MSRWPRPVRSLGNRAAVLLGKKLLRTPMVFGPADRLDVAGRVSLQNAILNTMSGRISIDEGTLMGHGVMILTGSHDLTAPSETRGTAIPPHGHDVHIGKNVWIGSGAIVVGPCRIGDGAVVAAGAVVKGDIGADTVVAGVPARPVRSRGEASP